MSNGGVHESLDGGRSWSPLNGGMELVENLDPSNGAVHDASICVRLRPSKPDGLHQQIQHRSPTSGALWVSEDEGWQRRLVARHLPEIYALESVVGVKLAAVCR